MGYYLKDTRCECGGEFLVIPAYVQEDGKKKVLVDSAVCQRCLREIVLPDDDYHEFGRRYCYVRPNP
jgi:hydrogenase maturation factor HypF (carbamoyltransferase family)